jgi:hypothetical protein
MSKVDVEGVLVLLRNAGGDVVAYGKDMFAGGEIEVTCRDVLGL